jgi:hypothetical protein
MSIKLTEYAKKPYTMQETQFFGFLPKNGDQISVKELVAARLKKGKWGTRYPSHVVSVVMRHLIEKTKLNREPFVIRRTEDRAGPAEMFYWVERKKKKVHSSILD